jgi:uncharacterized metal-binding protein YceD (DUF177 family)
MMGVPLAHNYNLARLGHAGDTVQFEASAEECAAIAGLAGALSLSRFAVQVDLKKLSPSRFLLDYRMDAEVSQACVVTLEPVKTHIGRAFRRELHFAVADRLARSDTPPGAVDLSGQDPEMADEREEISSLHFDLSGPALEEFLLALDPYPRCAGAAFAPGKEPYSGPESPFAILKSLKSSK